MCVMHVFQDETGTVLAYLQTGFFNGFANKFAFATQKRSVVEFGWDKLV